MKSKIKYFYNLFVDEIVLHDGYSVLSSAGHAYILKQVYDFDSNLAEINDYIEIILNKRLFNLLSSITSFSRRK